MRRRPDWSARRVDLHRRLGVAGVALAVGVVVLGYATAILTATPVAIPDRIVPPIIFPLVAVSTFGLLCAAGILWRQRPQHHKRAMLIATAALIVTPAARIGRMVGSALPPPIFGMLVTDLLLAALIAFDLRTRGKLHPATITTGALFLATQPLRLIIAQLPAWQAFAATFGAR